MRTSELSGAALDWAVALCEGWQPERVHDDRGEYWWFFKDSRGMNPKHYHASTNWAQGGAIIEREEISVSREFSSNRVEWAAWTPAPIRDDAEAFGYGATPLVAAMRCYVASKLGDNVEIPEGI
jgi:hypothetical protein